MRRSPEARTAALPASVDGRLAELCRDLAVQAKRLRQLQEQADELRTVLRDWAAGSEPDADHEPANRAGRR